MQATYGQMKFNLMEVEIHEIQLTQEITPHVCCEDKQKIQLIIKLLSIIDHLLRSPKRVLNL